MNSTMKRLKLSEWAERTYPINPPSQQTLRSMAKEGQIPGAVQIRKRWWVEIPSGHNPDDMLRRAVGNDPALLKVMGL